MMKNKIILFMICGILLIPIVSATITIDCGNGICDKESFELAKGQTETINVFGNDYDIKFEEEQGLDRTNPAVYLEKFGGATNLDGYNVELYQVGGNHPYKGEFSVRIDVPMNGEIDKIDVELDENEWCYSDCLERDGVYVIDIYKGWNLIKLDSFPSDKSDVDQLYRNDVLARYVYVSPLNTYWSYGGEQPPKSEIEYMQNNYGEDIINTLEVQSAVWVYSARDTKRYAEFSQWSLDSKNHNEILSAHQLFSGWNFINVLPAFEDKSLEEIKGDCDFTKVCLWNPQGQEWDCGDYVNRASSNFGKINVGRGVVLKADNDCSFGVKINPVPELPA
ncbi:hypothetical protein HOD83_03880 [Candidatus Woesearchaeota archaeon]|jgi:hypothetical protein|nr:hypothetical protein [Candidatus Woesearchaeota archaeon]MBT4248688.1 hypothetical protein [Candidatus Woesearchaeota archaeon]